MEPPTPESVTARNREIDAALAAVNSAAATYKTIAAENIGAVDILSSSKVANAQADFITKSTQLLTAARGPLESVFHLFHQVFYSGTIRALLELGVFDALPQDCSIMKAEILAEKLNVETDFLVRLMRCAVLLGPFAEPSAGEYAHTPYSLVYCAPPVKAFVKLAHDEFSGPPWKFAEYFKQNGWKHPASTTNNPYTLAHQTNGKDFWDHLNQFPERLSAFNVAMSAQSGASMWLTEGYPFADELKKLETDDDTVLFVDIGGGKGHIAAKVREVTSSVKGRVIVQDQQTVLNDIDSSLPGVEALAYDFFTPQPIQGARMYYLRRILHDWPDEAAVNILKNTASAMERGRSRVLISDLIFPESVADMETIYFDLSIMSIAGVERTRRQWDTLLAQAGLKVVRVFNVPGTKHCVIEAHLEGDD